MTGAVSRIVEETGDDEFRSLYAVANQLHTNFYEGELSAALVQRSLEDVARFVDKVEGLMESLQQ